MEKRDLLTSTALVGGRALKALSAIYKANYARIEMKAGCLHNQEVIRVYCIFQAVYFLKSYFAELAYQNIALHFHLIKGLINLMAFGCHISLQNDDTNAFSYSYSINSNLNAIIY